VKPRTSGFRRKRQKPQRPDGSPILLHSGERRRPRRCRPTRPTRCGQIVYGPYKIKAYFNGDGDPAYGPIPAYPKSPFLPSNAATNPYPFSVSDAISLLKANGWNVTPNGTDTCAKPGTGPGECGAGVPAGTKLAFNLIYNTTPPIPNQVEDLASDAKAAGIEIALSGSNFNFMIQNYNDSASTAYENKWAMEDFGGEANWYLTK
jgi:peptide/nickel transport system substrate-binding protein